MAAFYNYGFVNKLEEKIYDVFTNKYIICIIVFSKFWLNRGL